MFFAKYSATGALRAEQRERRKKRLVPVPEEGYTSLAGVDMHVEQIVEIPNSRQIVLDLPSDTPVGKARVSVFPISEMPVAEVSLLSMRGSCKGLDTMDAYFARKQADKAMEEQKSGDA